MKFSLRVILFYLGLSLLIFLLSFKLFDNTWFSHKILNEKKKKKKLHWGHVMLGVTILKKQFFPRQTHI